MGHRVVILSSACLLYLLCLLALATGASARGRDPAVMVLDNLDSRGPSMTLERPRRFELRSDDSRFIFFDLAWRDWGGPRAVARGRVRSCGPRAGCRTHPTVLTAGSRQRCAGEYFYDRLTASFVPLLEGRPVELPAETIPCAHPEGPAGRRRVGGARHG